MAYIPVPGHSTLEAVIYRIRRIPMSDWVKLGLSLAGFAIITWSMVQQHDYRIQKLENSVDTHLAKHEDQNEQIQKTLTQIQIDLSKLAK
jgi:hypothetical protein